MRGKTALFVAVGLLILGSLWYVHAPPRSADDYRERAVKTTETLRSQVQTTRIWLRTIADDRSTRSAASVGFREAEDDASRAASTFENHNPPHGTDSLRRQVSALAGDVTDALAQVRIAAHRGQWRELPDRGAALAELSKRLDELKRRARD